MTTLNDALSARAERGLADLLLLIFDAGVSYGSGQPWVAPLDPTAAALTETIKAKWHAELNSMRAWQREPKAPDWLQALADSPIADRPIADRSQP